MLHTLTDYDWLTRNYSDYENGNDVVIQTIRKLLTGKLTWEIGLFIRQCVHLPIILSYHPIEFSRIFMIISYSVFNNNLNSFCIHIVHLWFYILSKAIFWSPIGIFQTTSSSPDPHDTTCFESIKDYENFREGTKYWIEGVGILVVGSVGLLGNLLAILVFRRSRGNKGFHKLLIM